MTDCIALKLIIPKVLAGGAMLGLLIALAAYILFRNTVRGIRREYD